MFLGKFDEDSGGISKNKTLLWSNNHQQQVVDVRNPPASTGFLENQGLGGESGQPRVVVTARHQHALFHSARQFPFQGTKAADKAPAGVFTRQLLFYQGLNILSGSVRVTSSACAF